ncbi:MAG: NAD-dependent epimerase/dehydratase family protein [Pseudomonadota bacterium]|nr:NAD-dependent epimerase/dehydratase family protein [Pseudomonadota bacterium]
MNILILGGTVFVGRHLVDAAQAAGHRVTLFNRGRHGAPTGCELLVGDRRGDLAPLHGRRWDAAIDTATYVPSVARSAAQALAGAVGHYTFVSTRSVYADAADSTEEGAVATMTDDEVAVAEALRPEGLAGARSYGRHYGALKARCEAAVTAERDALVVRPGLIVGPHDPTDRYTYWVRRVATGGAVLSPGRPDRPVRCIDARDLAEWIIRCTERGTTGTFNAAGADRLTMAGLLDACRTDTAARFEWVDESVLLARGAAPWSEVPLWLPEADNAFLEVGNPKAEAEGLLFRPLAATARDTLAWDRDRGAPPLEAGMTPEREVELLRGLPAEASRG